VLILGGGSRTVVHTGNQKFMVMVRRQNEVYITKATTITSLFVVANATLVLSQPLSRKNILLLLPLLG